MAFKPATVEQSKLRLALIGPSGSGKTWTALTFSMVLGSRIALIDSERASASKYAGVFKFDTDILENHNPESYIRSIKDAERAGYDVIVIDSLSHAWAGRDGALELVDKAAKKSQSGNSFAAWREVTPLHNQLVDTILASRCHIIATMRAKTEWVMEENDKGKKVPRKIGLAPVQRDGVEYEFDVVADMTLDHDLIVSKTRCHLIDGVMIRRPGFEFAETLKSWLNTGVAPSPKQNAGSPYSAPGAVATDPAAVFASVSPVATNSSTAVANPDPKPSDAPVAASATQGTANVFAAAAAAAPATTAQAEGTSQSPFASSEQVTGTAQDTPAPVPAPVSSDPKPVVAPAPPPPPEPAPTAQPATTASPSEPWKCGTPEMAQLLNVGTKNGWERSQISQFVCHLTGLSAANIMAMTKEQWEIALGIVSHPGNSKGRVVVRPDGQPLPAEHHWPKAA